MIVDGDAILREVYTDEAVASMGPSMIVDGDAKLLGEQGIIDPLQWGRR